MGTNDEKNQFMTEAEEQRLGEGLRKALAIGNPNPVRTGCPDPNLIRAFAFHKRIGGPDVFEQVTTHMAICSACVRDALKYGDEYKVHQRRSRKVRMAMAVAAAIVLAVALWAIWRFQQKPEIASTPQVSPVQSPSQLPIADPADPGEQAPVIAQLESLTIKLPPTWRGAANPDNSITLPRKRMQLTIQLPIGSSDGIYKLRIVDKAGKVQVAAEGPARTVNGLTSLKATTDTSNLLPGNYSLSILEPEVGGWSDYSIVLR